VDLAGAFTVAGAPHPKAGELFLQWLASPEAQDAMGKVNRGRTQPCTGPSPQDKFLCGKKIDLFYMDTIEKMKRSVQERDEIAKILAAS
jgi:ABC-type Fe3+ transport system substrate-binding protein